MPSVSPPAVPAAACSCHQAVAPGSWASAPSGGASGSRRSSRRCLGRPCWPSLVPVPSSDSYARPPLPWTAQPPSGFRYRSSPRGLRSLRRRRFGLHPSPRCPSSARPDYSAAWPCEIAVLLASSTVQAFAGLPRLLCPLLTSALRSGCLAAPRSPVAGTTAQTSRGKTDRLHRTPAGFTTPTLDGHGLRSILPARPAG